MSWNGSDQASSTAREGTRRTDNPRCASASDARPPRGRDCPNRVAKGRNPSIVHLLSRPTFYLILLVVSLIGVAIYFIFFGRDRARPSPAPIAKRNSQIVAVTPAAAPTPKPRELTPEEKERLAHPGMVKASNGVWHPAGIPYNPKWKHAHKVHTNDFHRAGHSEEEAPYRNATEQLMYQLFSCRLGRNPPPLIRLPREEQKQLLSILLDKNPVDAEKDSEKLAIGKETIQQAKKELIEYMKEGGKPSDFFQYYHNELKKAYEKRQMAIDEIRRISDEEGDGEMAAQMREEVNKRLKADGIMPIGSHVGRVRKSNVNVTETAK